MKYLFVGTEKDLIENGFEKWRNIFYIRKIEEDSQYIYFVNISIGIKHIQRGVRRKYSAYQDDMFGAKIKQSDIQDLIDKKIVQKVSKYNEALETFNRLSLIAGWTNKTYAAVEADFNTLQEAVEKANKYDEKIDKFIIQPAVSFNGSSTLSPLIADCVPYSELDCEESVDNCDNNEKAAKHDNKNSKRILG